MIRAYDDNGNVVDLVEWEQQIRAEVIAEISREMRLLYGNEYEQQIRAEVIEECADLFSNILSDMTNVCGRNCPVKCNWGTEESCKDMCKKWFLEQLKEQNNIPMKPKQLTSGFYCPICNNVVGWEDDLEEQIFCSNCGQAIKWE